MKYTNSAKRMKTSEILLHPDGSLNEKTLPALLAETHQRKIPNTQRIVVCREVRDRAFNPENPNWVPQYISIRVSQLKEWYKEWTGEEYAYGSAQGYISPHRGTFFAENPVTR